MGIDARITGRVFGKQDYRRKDGTFGTTISFNLDCGEHKFLVGEQTITQKLTLFPSFKLGERAEIPACIKVGQPIIAVGDFYQKVPKDAFTLGDNGRRVDDLSQLDFKWTSLDVVRKKLFASSGTMLYNRVIGDLHIDKIGLNKTTPGAFLLLSEEMEPNRKATENVYKFRRAYIRAYAPPTITLPAEGREVFFEGRIMKHPLKADDNAPMLYIDRIIA